MKYKNEKYKKFATNEGGTKYYVSKSGKVISKKVHIHELKVFVTGKGYMYVKLTINHKSKAEFIHRLVAKTFIPNPDNKPEVNHIDGIKSNNDISNLEWVTSKENKEHAKKHKLSNYVSGEKCGRTNLTNDQIKYACELMVENKISLNKIAKKLDMPVDTLYQIRSKYIWKDISEKYVFPEYPISDNASNLDTVIQICEELEKGELSAKEISKKYNIGISTVNDIKHHRRHKNISKRYNF